VTIAATNCDNRVRVPSSRHIHTFWQQGEVCCCLRVHPSTAQHYVAVCANGRPFLADNVTDIDEGARLAERFWALFAEAKPLRD
jgi:predicted GNAT family N-acyltransferase